MTLRKTPGWISVAGFMSGCMSAECMRDPRMRPTLADVPMQRIPG
jgi:hypothetical protein